MPDISLAGASYRQAMLATASARSIEGAALAKAAADIQRSFDRRDRDHPGYIAALSRNLTLWTHLALDAAHPGNALPVDLRAAVIRLSAFVRAHTLRLQSRDAAVDAGVLLEINRNILAGLAGRAQPGEGS